MTRNESKKNRKRRRKILVALIMILLLIATLGTATYAWFTANRTVTVESIDVNVSTSQGLQISTDAVNWKSIVTNADITGATWSGVRNQLPSGTNMIVPVSTIGEVNSTTGYMKMFRGTVEANLSTGTNVLIAEESQEVNGSSGDFIAFDLFFQSSQAQTVYLTSNSSVVASGTDKGIQNAARVAFIKEGSVAYGSPASSAYALKGAESRFFWEPNYDVHTASGVANASNVYGVTVGQTGGSKLTYKGVKAEILAADNVALNSSSTSFFGDITTTGSVAAGIPDSAYLSAFDVAEGVTKIRIYMWIEGQDVDCEDHASGSALTYNLQFSIDSSA